MRSSLVRITLTALAVLAAAAGASAQEAADTTPKPRRATVHLVPSVSSMDLSILGWRPEDGSAVSALGDSRAYGLAVEVATPLRGVDMRVGLSATKPLLHTSRAPYDGAEFTRASLTTLTVDAVVRGPRLLDFRPYAVVGAGYRYYDFIEGGQQLTQNQGRTLAHLGAGVAWDVGRYELTLEGGRYYHRLIADEQLRDADVNSSTLTLGLRIPLN